MALATLVRARDTVDDILLTLIERTNLTNSITGQTSNRKSYFSHEEETEEADCLAYAFELEIRLERLYRGRKDTGKDVE